MTAAKPAFSHPVHPYRKLALVFVPVRLKNDLRLIEPQYWSPADNENIFGGTCSRAVLRAPTGPEQFVDTPLLALCPYFREALAAFRCPLQSVMLLSLAPSSLGQEHSDDLPSRVPGKVRIEIPIQTNPDVEFYVCGNRLLLEEGGSYYLNLNLPHRVNNRGIGSRVHLVVDAVIDTDAVPDWLQNACAIPRSSRPPAGFDRFANRVISDGAVCARLRAIDDHNEFVQAVVQEAASRGFDFNEADVEAGFRATLEGPSAATAGWLPIRADLRAPQPSATSIYAPDHHFTEPFFDDEVRTCLRNPFTALFRREIPLVSSSPVQPDGFIFHMSRCGSTLISRSLAAAESTTVLSEPSPLDEVVRTGRADWLEQTVSALGQSRPKSHYLLKLNPWHIHQLPLFRQVFPGVPWIFVFRDPLEVLVSQLRMPGIHTSPGAIEPALLGMSVGDVTALTRVQWCVRVLERLMLAAAGFQNDPLGLFIDYDELPGAITGRIADHFRLNLSAKDRAQVEAATRLDAKKPAVGFESDRAEKRRLIEALGSEASAGSDSQSDIDNLRRIYSKLALISAR